MSTHIDTVWQDEGGTGLTVWLAWSDEEREGQDRIVILVGEGPSMELLTEKDGAWSSCPIPAGALKAIADRLGELAGSIESNGNGSS